MLYAAALAAGAKRIMKPAGGDCVSSQAAVAIELTAAADHCSSLRHCGISEQSRGDGSYARQFRSRTPSSGYQPHRPKISRSV